MPYFANSPEVNLERSDSLDPARTCKGTTTTGRACRRGLPSSPPPTKTDPQSFYCWQHKGQARDQSSWPARPAASSSTPASTHSHNVNHDKVDHRTSIDSMMQRLGLEDSNYNQNGHYGKPLGGGPRPRPRSRRTYCCCFQVWETEEDHLPPVRPSRQQQDGARARKNRKPLIPPTIPASTAALLRSELNKPLSVKDEPGYIYIFWLTPEEASAQSRGPPPAELFFSPTTSNNEWQRSHSLSTSLSDAIRSTRDSRVFVSKPTGTNPGTIRLKIGRASNVQRRLNEWSRQCSYNLTLIRYYPYTHSRKDSPPKKVPYAHRVEHLIHIELNEKRVRDIKCPECGKQHKEWFEIEADKDELKKVDDCVRRWVTWAERASIHR